jgi:hypothetical protein
MAPEKFLFALSGPVRAFIPMGQEAWRIFSELERDRTQNRIPLLPSALD